MNRTGEEKRDGTAPAQRVETDSMIIRGRSDAGSSYGEPYPSGLTSEDSEGDRGVLPVSEGKG